MKQLFAIGEALIDFIPAESEKMLKDVGSFSPSVGGAPANVCGAFTRLGGKSHMITQLGADPFGDKIVQEFERYGIGTEHIIRTENANTSLAFVALKADGNREFSFYRKPGADMLYDAENIKQSWFKDLFALHFCSVSLGRFPMKQAHRVAIACAKKEGGLISFDPNLRFPLWESRQALYDAVWEFLPLAHILKISDEELLFLTGKDQIEDALPQLFVGDVKLIVYTKGAGGAAAYTKQTCAQAEGQKVKAVDTTGAGDAFIGSFLYQLAAYDVTVDTIGALEEETLRTYLDFSNRYCACSVQKAGVIASYPTMEDMIHMIRSN